MTYKTNSTQKSLNEAKVKLYKTLFNSGIVLNNLTKQIKTKNFNSHKLRALKINNNIKTAEGRHPKIVLKSFNSQDLDLIPYITTKDLNVNFKNIFPNEVYTTEGTFSKTFLKLVNKNNRESNKYVIKITKSKFHDDKKNLLEEFLGNFLNYILMKNSNNNMHILKVYEFGYFLKPYRGVYVIMEKCNSDLNDYLITNQRLFSDYHKEEKITYILKYFKQMLIGVNLIHKGGYVHMDIKLENFLVKIDDDNNPIIKIADFGHYKKEGELISSPSGTYKYMDPKIANLSRVDKRIKVRKIYDIFSLGCCFYLLNVMINNLDKPKSFFPFNFKRTSDENFIFLRSNYYNIYFKDFEDYEPVYVANKFNKLYGYMNQNFINDLVHFQLKMICKYEDRYNTIDNIITDLDKLLSKVNNK